MSDFEQINIAQLTGAELAKAGRLLLAKAEGRVNNTTIKDFNTRERFDDAYELSLQNSVLGPFLVDQDYNVYMYDDELEQIVLFIENNEEFQNSDGEYFTGLITDFEEWLDEPEQLPNEGDWWSDVTNSDNENDHSVGASDNEQ